MADTTKLADAIEKMQIAARTELAPQYIRRLLSGEREVRLARRFHFAHNPPNTGLAQSFNNILEALGVNLYATSHQTDSERIAEIDAAINGPAACSAEPHELDPTGMAMWDEVERHVQAGGTLPMTDKPRAQAWCAHGVRADLKCEQCAAQEGVGSAGSGATLPSFKEYWATKKAQGFQYGSDALEQVRMGYEDAARYAQGMADELARVRTELTDYKTGKAEAWTIIDRLTAELAKAREAREFLVAKRKTGESDDD